MKKSDVAAVFMLIFTFILIYEVYDAFVVRDYFGYIDFIIITVIAILILIPGFLMLKWGTKETEQKYREKFLINKKKENDDKKL